MISDSMNHFPVYDTGYPPPAETLNNASDKPFDDAQTTERTPVLLNVASNLDLPHRAPTTDQMRGISRYSGSNVLPMQPIYSSPVSSLDTLTPPGWSERISLPRGQNSTSLNSPSSCMLVELGDDRFFLAASSAMRALYAKVCTIAPFDVPVLITGESGVGKEVIANLLHRRSARATRQFLKINCAALPNDLLESELFGYEVGAFTGALKSKPGKFEQCAKGTILLDEIGEMSPTLQAKLLHVLQDGEFSRLGARVNTKVDVRIVAATNVDIEQAITERKFREDLYYRLNAFILHIPPIRERREEIPYFLSELSKRLSKTHLMEPIDFSPRLLAAAVDFNWPGNLRDLVNFVKRHLILRDEASAIQEIESKMLSRKSSPVTQFNFMGTNSNANLKSVVRSLKDQAEIRMIVDTLDETHWNRRIAAERLQISYRALLYKIKQYSLAVSS
jgi:two-component system response regulator AtoC